jgi:hypothetical protein
MHLFKTEHLKTGLPAEELNTKNHLGTIAERLFCHQALVASGSANRTWTNVQSTAKKVDDQFGGVYL